MRGMATLGGRDNTSEEVVGHCTWHRIGCWRRGNDGSVHRWETDLTEAGVQYVELIQTPWGARCSNGMVGKKQCVRVMVQRRVEHTTCGKKQVRNRMKVLHNSLTLKTLLHVLTFTYMEDTCFEIVHITHQSMSASPPILTHHHQYDLREEIERE